MDKLKKNFESKSKREYVYSSTRKLIEQMVSDFFKSKNVTYVTSKDIDDVIHNIDFINTYLSIQIMKDEKEGLENAMFIIATRCQQFLEQKQILQKIEDEIK